MDELVLATPAASVEAFRKNRHLIAALPFEVVQQRLSSLLDIQQFALAFCILDARSDEFDKAGVLLGALHGLAGSSSYEHLIVIKSELRRLLTRVANAVFTAGGAGMDVLLPLLAHIVQQLQSGDGCVTPLHPLLAQLALFAHEFHTMRPVLEAPVFGGVGDAAAGWGTTSTDVLLYFYYGGMLFCGMRDWAAACDFFKTCIAGVPVPHTGAPSAIQVEAWRKCILTSLLATGRKPDLGKLLTGDRAKSITEGLCEPYAKLATNYSRESNPQALTKAIEEHRAAFAAEGNLGLVNRVQTSFWLRALKRMSLTYSRITTEDIQKVTGASTQEAATDICRRLIALRYLQGGLDEGTGALTFEAAPAAAPVGAAVAAAASAAASVAAASQQVEGATYEALRSQIESLGAALHALHMGEKDIVLTDVFMQKLSAETMGRRPGGAAGAAPSLPYFAGGAAGDEFEDPRLFDMMQ